MDQPRTIKHYELLERLGEGGMGVVYRARDTRLGRTVALKVLPEDLSRDEERTHRFEREARIVSGLSHPGIATLYDFDRDGDVAFLSMELVEGSTLRDLILPGPMPVETVLDCGVQVSEALAAAHRGGVVHRDLKPENIMASDSGYYKVLDFGVARMDDVTRPGTSKTQTPTRTFVTKAGSLIGTVSYMSPEQVMGQPVDTRSDIFSFGSVLYEMTTGKPAFRSTNDVATAHAIAYEPIEPMVTTRGEIPEGLELITAKCLEKKPEDRYDRAEDLARDLRALRIDSLSGSRTGTTLIAARKPQTSRRRWILGLGITGVVLLLAAFGVLQPWRRPPAHVFPEAIPPPAPPARFETATPAAVESRPRVIVAFFENNTGDSSIDWIGRGMPEMLTTDLSSSPELDVIATQRLYDLMSAAGQEMPVLDRSSTAELARWAGANVVISGSVVAMGEQYRIDAQAYDTGTGTIRFAHKVQGTDLFAMVDDLTAALLRGLQVGEVETPTGVQVAAAMRPFLDGRRLYENLQFREATSEFDRSLAADPEFARANLYRAMTFLREGKKEQALPLFAEIETDPDRLPDAERLLFESLDAFYREQDPETGERLMETLVDKYPRNAEAWVWRAQVSREVEGDPRKAFRHLQRAIRVDPSNLQANVALSKQLMKIGAVDEARSLLEQARELNPEARPAIERLLATFPE